MVSEINEYCQKYRYHLYLFISLLSIYLIAFLLLKKLLLHHDVSWLLEVSRRMLLGGDYLDDFFENNPPLILYLYAPPVLLNLYWNVKLVLAFRVYIFILGTTSLLLTRYFIKQIFNEPRIANLILAVLAIIYFVLPGVDFGQREHMMLILIMPYLFMLAARIKGSALHPQLALLVGLLAGLGFCIKPYFLICLVSTECYLMFKQKKVCFWRPEILAIFTVVVSYVFLVLFQYDDYLTMVVPFASNWVYIGCGYPLRLVINYAPIIFIFFIASYACLSKPNVLEQILIVALLSFLLIYGMQQTRYFYHYLPALSLALLLSFLLIISEIKRPMNTWLAWFRWLMIVVFLIAYSYRYIKVIWTVVIFEPTVYLAFFAALMFLLSIIWAKEKSMLSLIIRAMVYIALLMFFLFLSTHTLSNVFLITTIFALLLAVALISHANKLFVFSKLVMVMLLLAIPFYQMNVFYQMGAGLKEMYRPFRNFLHSQHAAHKTIYFLDTSLYAYPLTDYAGVTSVARFSTLWMLPAFIKLPYVDPKFDRAKIKSAKDFLINMVAEDLIDKKPAFVFVDVSKNKAYFHLEIPGVKKLQYLPFDYLAYFNTNSNFRSAWQNYTYITTLSENAWFKENPYSFAVYKRIAGK